MNEIDVDCEILRKNRPMKKKEEDSLNKIPIKYDNLLLIKNIVLDADYLTDDQISEVKLHSKNNS